MKHSFEVGDDWSEEKRYHVDKIVGGEGYYGSVVVLSFLMFSDIGDDGGEAEKGEIGEHEVDTEDDGQFHGFRRDLSLLLH